MGEGYHQLGVRAEVRAKQLQGRASQNGVSGGGGTLRNQLRLAGRLAQPLRLLDAQGTDLDQDHQLLQVWSLSRFKVSCQVVRKT